MAPFTAWLPPQPTQDFDLIVKVAGSGTFQLHQDWVPLADVLIEQGLAVMAERRRLNSDADDVALHFRMAVQPFYSMGHGCDVLIHVGDNAPEFLRFDLQPGSVLLWEPPAEGPVYSAVPEGVITYPLPLSDLCAPYGEGASGKGLAALGALLHLLGCSEDALRRVTPLLAAPQSFAAGVEFAHREITKRDAYWLPLPTIDDGPRQVLLASEQAMMLGFSVSSCECGTTCANELLRSPEQWMAKHMVIARGMVSVLESEWHPGVRVYRGFQGKVMALCRGDDAVMTSCLDGCQAPRILVAADVADILKLVIKGHDLIRTGLSDGVGILIEDTLAMRHESIELSVLQRVVRRRGVSALQAVMTVQSDLPVTAADHDNIGEVDVGFVSWGSAQGVVRDAVALCRGVGLNVAGLYPKAIAPFPWHALEAFVRTARRVVLVESNQSHGYGELVRAACSFQPTVLMPPPGKSLTPMDIFLREGLGTV